MTEGNLGLVLRFDCRAGKDLDPVVFPEVGVPGQRRLGQERRGERASRGRLPQTRFADEKICVREAV